MEIEEIKLGPLRVKVDNKCRKRVGIDRENLLKSEG